MITPNFFIVGAAKAGTTSLYHYLEQHPEIGMASYKEPCFYCHNQLYENEESYYELFSHIPSEVSVIGEASTNYLSAPESPKLIKRKVPAAKIIILLRHPVDRAFSLYKWMVRAGFEYASTFETAMSLEKQRQNDKQLVFSPVKYNFNYFASGLYYDQVMRYYENFDKENILIINFDDLQANSKNVLTEVFDFLGVNNIEIKNTKIFNKAKYPISAKAQYFLRNNLYNLLTLKKKKQGRMYGNLIVDSLAGINSNLGKEPVLNRNTAKALQKRYNENLIMISESLNISIEQWLTKY